ncbi:MAG TPA: heparinase II/III-family protein [Vicinamibacteria bacterium]|nr:heparinase II/III-family protein [Vicinamibacteria bacterium]
MRHFDDGSFRFLNETHHFEGPETWRPQGVPKPWADELHAFRWLWELPPGDAVLWIQHWLDHNPPLAAPGWDAYPLSLRLREWIEWLLAHPDAPQALRERMVASLAHQARVLEDELEVHLQGERLLENAISLCWAAFSLRGPSSDRWLGRGRRLLRQQLGVQVLRDGSHDARSPMIQSQLAEALLRLAEAAGPSPMAQSVRDSARAAGEVFVQTLQLLTHPDGEIALLNDSACCQAPTARELKFRFPAADGDEEEENGHTWSLPSAGYYGLRGRGPYLVMDAGPLGPDHQPAHGHADVLSFELSHDGRRLLTDTGVFTYERGVARSRDRGTAAHNTVQVDGMDQSEVYGAFSCGRRVSRVHGMSRTEGEVDRLAAGYVGTAEGARLQHARECRFEPPWLRFTDRLAASGRHEAVLRLHVAPGLTVQPSPDGPRLVDSGLPLALVQGTGFEWSLEESPYHPELGREVMRPCLFALASFRDQLTVEWGIRLL